MDISRPSLPVVGSLPSGVRLSANARSEQKRELKERTLMANLASKFKSGAQIIKMPFSLESLRTARVSTQELEEECVRLQNVDPHATSAIFVDVHDEPILAYVAHRAIDSNLASPTVSLLPPKYFYSAKLVCA